jgi:hypothetical protein
LVAMFLSAAYAPNWIADAGTISIRVTPHPA